MAHSSVPPLRTVGALASGAGALLIYLLLEWLSFIHEYKGLPITPWNPGLGVLLALMILGGGRYVLVLFVGALTAEFVVIESDLPPVLSVAVAGVMTVGYGAVAVAIRRRSCLDVALHRLHDIMILLGMGIGAAILVAVLLPSLLIVGGQLDLADAPAAALPLFIGDAIGIAVMTPLILRLFGRAGSWSQMRWPMALGEIGFYVLVGSFVFWIAEGENGSNLRLFYIFFLPVVVAAIRHGIDGACVALCLIQLVLVGLAQMRGYDAFAFTEAQSLMLVLTTTGLIVGAVVSERQASDRTARETQARLKEKEAEAAQAARLNLMSGMASALAHEINQPMTAARALARSVQQILRMPDGDFARADANISTVIAQIDHAGEVIRRVRDFIRRGQPSFSEITIRELLDDALALVKDTALTNGIRIQLELAEPLPKVYGDAVQLQQVIVNLVQNAIDSIGSGAQADGLVRVGAASLDDPRRLEFWVWDNGGGLSSELASHVFEPFRTSKSEGLGLGLAICASIVQSHGGRIWLESGLAGATEFRFSLPLEPEKKPI